MGLLAKYKQFKQKRLESAIVKNLKLINNPKSVREDRAAAIEFFKFHSDPDTAVPALLGRFDYSLEHGINDTREKESALEGIVKFKKAALPHITSHLKRSDRIAWPIKAFKQLASDDEIIASLASCLDYSDVAMDQKKVDKNYDILCYLRDYKLPTPVTHKLVHLLDDLDERVRFATVEALIEQADVSLPAKLERFLKDDSSENTRIRQAVVSAFVRNNWEIHSREEFHEGPLLPGVIINKSYHVVAAKG